MRRARTTDRAAEGRGCVAAEAEADEMLAGTDDSTTLDRRCPRGGRRAVGLDRRVHDLLRIRLRVDEGVYVPRPQTEELARRAVALLPAGGRALDLCTGTGAIAAHLAAPPDRHRAHTDIDERAARCARRNGVTSLAADLTGPFRRQPGST